MIHLERDPKGFAWNPCIWFIQKPLGSNLNVDKFFKSYSAGMKLLLPVWVIIFESI